MTELEEFVRFYLGKKGGGAGAPARSPVANLLPFAVASAEATAPPVIVDVAARAAAHGVDLAHVALFVPSSLDARLLAAAADPGATPEEAKGFASSTHPALDHIAAGALDARLATAIVTGAAPLPSITAPPPPHPGMALALLAQATSTVPTHTGHALVTAIGADHPPAPPAPAHTPLALGLGAAVGGSVASPHAPVGLGGIGAGLGGAIRGGTPIRAPAPPASVVATGGPTPIRRPL
jgi:hypothetical protein